MHVQLPPGTTRKGSIFVALLSRPALCAAAAMLVCFQGLGAVQAQNLPQVLTGVNARFSGAELPVVNGNDMVINQVTERATLHWQSFNIGANNSVEFVQPSSSSVALNRIFDSVPSEIAGRLSANGQVYLINQNGILFTATAQVNTQSLVASTLDIDDLVFEEIGFVNAINEQPDALAAFDSFGQPMGEIRIEAGATLESESTGRILIFAPSIVNEGTIRTPDGQTVLAASQDQVFIAASQDSDLRGLLVEVSTGGDVTNVGELIAERGNVSLLGLAVNQNGVARATTSVSLNGSIRLVAQDMDGTPTFRGTGIFEPRRPVPNRGGDLVLGEGSVTEVVPDASVDDNGDPIVAFDAQAQPRSVVDLAATRVLLETGARVTSTGGDLDIIAADNPGIPRLLQTGDPDLLPIELRLEPGAVLDVSGDKTTAVPMERNVIEVEARGNELADAPVQRDGPIRNETLRVDLRRGTDFLDTSGAEGSIGRTANERQSVGGALTIRSEGAVVAESGSSFDISGGQVEYLDGIIATSQLRQVNGQVVEISSADPDQQYTGVAPDAVRQESGYIEGKDAGQLNIGARGVTLDGDVLGSSRGGVNQRGAPESLGTTPAYSRPFDQSPLGGTLSINLLRVGLPDIVIGTDPGITAGPPPLVIPAEALAESGVEQLVLLNAGRVLVNESFSLPEFGEVNLAGTTVEVLGDIRVPGGTVILDSTNQSVGEGVVPNDDLLTRVAATIDVSGVWTNDNQLVNDGQPDTPIVLNGGEVRIGSGGSIRVEDSSLVDVSAGARRSAQGRTSGGRGGLIAFETNRIDDPQLGARLELAGVLRGFGFDGGGTLQFGVERVEVLPDPSSPSDTELELEATQRFASREVDGGQGNSQFVLEVSDAIFRQGGFENYLLSSARLDLEVATGADIRLRAAQLLLDNPAASLAPTGTPVADLAQVVVLPDFQRRPTNLSLSTNGSLGAAIGGGRNLTISTGAAIRTDAGAAISLASTNSLVIDGVIDVPGGTIDLQTGENSGLFLPDRQLWLGPNARLSVDAVALVDTLNPLGFRFGQLLPGGRISVRAEEGSLLVAEGASLSADGGTERLDVGFDIPQRREIAAAAGEIELIAAESLLFRGSLSARAPDGFDVAGGRLRFGIDPSTRGVQPLLLPDGIPRGPHTVVFENYQGDIPGVGEVVDPSLASTGFVPVDQLQGGGFDALDIVVRSSATSTSDQGVPTPDTPDSLPIIEFPVDLDLALAGSVTLDAALFRTTDSDVRIAAPYVALGYTDERVPLDGSIPDKTSADNPQDTSFPIRLTPSVGAGSLVIDGGLVELVGEAVTEGFGDTSIDTTGVAISASEEIRVRGVRKFLSNDYRGLFRTAGQLDLSAPSVYPVTLSDVEVSVEGAGGRIGIGGTPSASAPLSVGGRLVLNAETIEQGGGLFAPLGRLEFNAAQSLVFSGGSLTSTSPFGVNTPFFRTEPGGALILPAQSGSQDQLVFVEAITNDEFERQLPTQLIDAVAPAIDLQPGSRFDLSGGGDIRAYEFVPGPGGSQDILLAELESGPNPSFAVLPGAGSFAPFDPLESPAAADQQGLRVGDSIVLEEGLNGLPAGEYALLPARYALYGGFLVTPAPGTRDLDAGRGLQTLDGSPILAGRVGAVGSGAGSSRSRGFVVEDGDAVRLRAEYLETPLADVYTDGVVRTPNDAGTLVLEAGTDLNLQGELVSRETLGLGTAVDIASAEALSVVTEFTGVNGIELRAADLDALGADSLLLGGVRSRTADGVLIDPVTSGVIVQSGVSLELPEILLVGDSVQIVAAADSPTTLRSDAAATGQAQVLRLDKDAAIVALSNRELSLRRSGVNSGSSSLSIAENSRIEAVASVLLDATADVDVAGEVSVESGRLGLGASKISIGETDGETIDGGLILSNEELAALAGNNLNLRSTGRIDVYGTLGIDGSGELIVFDRLTVDAAGIALAGNDGDIASLAADVLEIGNSGAEAVDDVPVDTTPGSRLELLANQLRLADGAVSISGFETTRLEAGSAAIDPVLFDQASEAGLLLSGDTVLTVGGGLEVAAPVIAAEQATSAEIEAAAAVQVLAGDDSAALPSIAGQAARLRLAGSRIDYAGRTVLPSGSVTLVQRGDPASPGVGDGLVLAPGAIVDVSGQALDYGPATVSTPGGVIRLIAETGDVRLNGGSRVDVSAGGGDAEAGELAIAVPNGNLLFSATAELLGRDDTSSSGQVRIDVRTLAPADSGDGSFASLNQLLEAGGFRAARAIRLRDADIDVGTDDVINARDIRLVSDTGSLTVAGKLDASGPTGGRIWLAAADVLTVSGNLDASAVEPAGDGGRVDLYALDADGDDPDGASDRVEFLAGASIDVSGGAEARGGEAYVHQRRLDTNDDGQTDLLVSGVLDGTVAGAERAELIATRRIRDPNAVSANDPETGLPITVATITDADIQSWRDEADAFLNATVAPAGPLRLAPGILVESTGDLVLADTWDFYTDWYFGRDTADPTAPVPGVTGVASLRAARNLDIRADLTDNFALTSIFFGFFELDLLQGAIDRLDEAGNVIEQFIPQSWGYRLAAGADLSSADVLATADPAGSLTLASGARVRTGTADIDLSVGGDLVLEDGASVYTGGWSKGTVDELNDVLQPAGISGDELYALFLNGAQFPTGGGDVSISAGGNISAAGERRQITNWLTRIGEENPSNINLELASQFGAIPTHWGIVFDQFGDGLGTLGGGKLTVDAGGVLRGVTLATPTAGRAIDGFNVDTTGGQIFFLPSDRTFETLGGGVIDVTAGGDIEGGQVVLGRGEGRIRSRGDTGLAEEAPSVYIGEDAQLAWLGAGSIELAGISDPTVADLSESQLTLLLQTGTIVVPSLLAIANEFYTYTDATEVSVTSLGGNVELDGPEFTDFLPPTLRAASLGGDVNIAPPLLVTFPAPSGQLELLARDNVTGNFSGSAQSRLTQSDQDPTLLPSVDRPAQDAGVPLLAASPVRRDSEVPNLFVALDGSIQSLPGAAGFLTIELAKPGVFQAGTDISNISVRVQNIREDALTSFTAGRDIVQGTLRTNTGRFAASDPRIFEIWGPGAAEFVAGRDISLGTSSGIETIGNVKNAALVDEGSSVILLAGTGGEPAYDRFVDVYLSDGPSFYRDQLNVFLSDVDAAREGFVTEDPDRQLPIGAGEYREELLDFLDEFDIPVVDDDPVTTFQALDRSRQRIFINDVVFAELNEWGTASETAERADRLNYIRGFTALDTLFELDMPLPERYAMSSPQELQSAIQSYLSITDPDAANRAQVDLFGALFPPGEPKGDISLLLSQVQTLAGGDLSMLGVGGDINAGAADADIIDKGAADLGIVTAAGGDINLLVDRDLLVNSTRAFALQGDLQIWSSNGNIDAGKGAKTVTSVPDPITRIDPNTGQTIIEFPPAVAGSGLQGENAFLFAPRGSVNAGDAGIRTSGDLTIGAVEVVGSDNIDVGGVEIGFSTGDVVAVAPPGASDAGAAAAQSVDSRAAMLSDEDELGERTLQGTQVAFITVDVLSFGEPCDPEDENCAD